MRLFVRPEWPITALWSRGTRVMTKEYGELVDMESGCWAAVLGHNHPDVVRVIHEQVDTLLHTHQFFQTEHPEKLVEELSEAAKLPSKYSGSFLSSGSEAVSLAVMLSELLTGKRKKLCMNITYLGACKDLRHPRDNTYWDDLDVTGCLGCGELGTMGCNKRSEINGNTKDTNERNCATCGRYNHLNFSQYASFVFEPGNSGGLVLTPPAKLVTFLAGKVRAAGGLLVVNEVTTGFGRTGEWFGFQHYEFMNDESNAPDLIALGKGLGNGYPISAVLVRENLAMAAEMMGIRYVQSHIDDPLGCRIAREIIKVMVEGEWVLKGHETGKYIRSRLMDIAAKNKEIKEIHGRGMMNVVMLEKGVSAEAIFKGLLGAGYFCGFSEQLGFIHLYAPLIISKEEVNGFCNALEQVVNRLH
ncbi:aminotransferase class III-fold pyridoxal phosphate-dependent enzyme [Acetobacterium woodii]|uniref:4-aminobutyrate aminotransferase GabT1 n=1 Tax=Acetobacterium woodii (strain ATCC 29683 / DSM 1030 / JCM 2381 / KCTC 1655 / WB1) TaxID=931626 RepID=H6LDU9_ACEWD|nr:aminotransferase class III-fold pyridoxal phosphate-dependent enzyme [Acetobacterium woodii]AFA47992.1 4-aminobutyrate aminotransferase GabT1 [Acetobacterium woodii DSM 1030]